MIITCICCGAPATLICIHHQCQLAAYVCSEQCGKKGQVCFHQHEGQGVFMNLDKFDRYINNLSCFKFVKHINEMKARLMRICDQFTNMVETYENDLKQLQMKLKTKAKNIINKIALKQQITGMEASFLLKGEDMYENQYDTMVLTNKIKNSFIFKIKSIQSIMKEQINLSTINIQVDLMIKKGVDEMWNNNWNEALSIFKQCHSINPLNPMISKNIAKCFVNCQKYDLAIQTLQKTLKLVDDEKQISLIYNTIAQIHQQNKNDLCTALNYYNKAIQLNSSYYFLFLNRARCNRLLTNISLAIQDISYAIKLKPLKVCYQQRNNIIKQLKILKQKQQRCLEDKKVAPQ